MGLNYPGVRTGDLRHIVVIEQVTRAKDESGNDSETWADYEQLRAAIRPTSGREYFSGRQVVAEASSLLVMYYRPINAADYRVRYDDPKSNQVRYYGIRAVVTPDETRGFMALFCDEVDPA